MDGLIELVYSIPLIGLVFQFLGYLLGTLPDIAPDHPAGRRARSPSPPCAACCASARAS